MGVGAWVCVCVRVCARRVAGRLRDKMRSGLVGSSAHRTAPPMRVACVSLRLFCLFSCMSGEVGKHVRGGLAVLPSSDSLIPQVGQSVALSWMDVAGEGRHGTAVTRAQPMVFY